MGSLTEKDAPVAQWTPIEQLLLSEIRGVREDTQDVRERMMAMEAREQAREDRRKEEREDRKDARNKVLPIADFAWRAVLTIAGIVWAASQLTAAAPHPR